MDKKQKQLLEDISNLTPHISMRTAIYDNGFNDGLYYSKLLVEKYFNSNENEQNKNDNKHITSQKVQEATEELMSLLNELKIAAENWKKTNVVNNNDSVEQKNNNKKQLLFENKKLIDNMCISYRHDFGLMNEEQRNQIRFECKEWLRAYENNKNCC